MEANVVSSGNNWKFFSDGTLEITGNTGDFSSSSKVPWVDYHEQILSVRFSGNVTKIGVWALADLPNATSIILPEGVTEIGKNAFQRCYALTDLQLPTTLKTIGDYAFSRSESLKQLELPEGLTTIGASAFVQSALEEIVIPESVTSLGGSAFSNCHSLVRAVLPQGLTVIPSSLFYNCAQLREVNIPDTVTEIVAMAFAELPCLTEVLIPASVEILAPEAFCCNTALTEFVVEAGNANYKTVDGVLFTVDGKQLMTFPAGRTGSYSIPEGTEILGRYTFGRSRLSIIEIPASMTTLEKQAFAYCNNLTSIYLGDNVTTVGEYLFQGVSSLKRVIFGPAIESVGGYLSAYLCPIGEVYFTGDAPSFDGKTFRYFDGTPVYYPAGNATWDSVITNTYGGNPVWIPYEGEVPDLEEEYTEQYLQELIDSGSGQIELDVPIVIENDYVLPGDVNCYMFAGSIITVPDGVTFTIENDIMVYGGTIHVEEGGTLRTTNGSCPYLWSADSVVIIDGEFIGGTVYRDYIDGKFMGTITGVPMEQQALRFFIHNETELRKALQLINSSDYSRYRMCIEGDITITQNTTLPALCDIYVNDATLTLSEGCILTNEDYLFIRENSNMINNGTIENNATIYVEGMAKNNGLIHVNDYFVIDGHGTMENCGTVISRGTIENYGV